MSLKRHHINSSSSCSADSSSQDEQDQEEEEGEGEEEKGETGYGKRPRHEEFTSSLFTPYKQAPKIITTRV